MADANQPKAVVNRGRFITLEGVDGAGKSTHIPWIAEQLRAAGREIVVTREPGGTPLAEALRELVLSRPMDAVAETLLMFAARADHVKNIIRPALEGGAWVLCDRFTDATLAYQGAGKGIDAGLITRLSRAAHPGLEPDRTFVFDCPYEVSRRRIDKAGRTLDRFETEAQSFFERVREAYRAQALAAPARVKLLDATRSIAELQAAIASDLAFE